MTSFKEFISERTDVLNEGLYAEKPYDIISTNCFGFNLWNDFLREIEKSYKGLSLHMSLDGKETTHRANFSCDRESKEKFIKEMLEDGGKKFSSLWTDYCRKFFKIKNLKIDITIFDLKEARFNFEMDIHINTTIKYARG